MTTKTPDKATGENLGSGRNKKHTTEQPWSLRGITKETRTYIEKAAKKERKKIGEWANEKLFKAAQETLSSKSNLPVKQEDLFDKFDSIEKAQTEQTEKMEQLTKLLHQLTEKDKFSLVEKIFGRKKENA